MTGLSTFVFDDETPHPVRVIVRDGEPWFVARDVCAVLGIKDASDAVEPLDDDEKGRGSTPTLGGEQETLIVSEGGLYTLILRSRQATTPGSAAHRFRKWVTGELLPQIRKTGRYAAPDPTAGWDWQAIGEKVKLVRETRLALGRKAAEALWLDLGLPDVIDKPEPERTGSATAFGIDFVRQFLSERTEQAPGGRVQAQELHQAYCRWATQTDTPTITVTAFGLCMATIGLRKINASGRRFYLGIRIKHLSEFSSQLGD